MSERERSLELLQRIERESLYASILLIGETGFVRTIVLGVLRWRSRLDFAIESLAENFSDGVVSPVFWIWLVGLTGGAVYKAVNTADSMIGHRTERYESFGKPAAQLDDLVNLPGARLSGLLIVAGAALSGSTSAAGAWHTMIGDASKHASPNAGYPEAAMAGALGLALGGPRSYEGKETDGAWLGDGRREAKAVDVYAALELYGRADGLLIALVFLLAALTATM